MTDDTQKPLAQLTNSRLKPREKLAMYGISNLSTAELIALILGTGTTKHSVFALASYLTSIIENRLLSTMPLQKLRLGKNHHARLLAAVELANRLAISQPTLSKPEDIWHICSHLAQKRHEYVVALYLDGQHQLIEKQVIAIGGHNFAMLEPMNLLYPAIKLPASACALVHNHPSGDHQPSPDDIAVSRRLFDACELMGITLLDHVVISSRGWSSLKKLGFL